MRKMLVQSAAAATGNGKTLTVTNQGSSVFQVSGTFVGTVTWESTVDETNWIGVQAINLNSGAVALTATAPGLFCIPCAGLGGIRARISAWTSGTISVEAIAVQSAPASLALSIAAGAALIGTVAIDQTTPGTTNRVDIGTIAAGETHIGQFGGEGTTISLTPTVTAGAYSANDAVGGLLTFANAARVAAGGGMLSDVTIVDDAGQDAELELWLFNVTFTAMTDNAAWAPSEADLENWIGTYSTSTGTWRDAGTPSGIHIKELMRYDLVGTSLFGQLVTRGTPTYAATDDLTVKVKVLQD